MFLVIWTYRVKPEHAAEFENVYGRDGAWAQLFRNAEGYLGTDLFHDRSEADRYMTVDRWSSANAYEAFLANWKKEYESLDEQCERLTEEEIPLGRWETIPDETR